MIIDPIPCNKCNCTVVERANCVPLQNAIRNRPFVEKDKLPSWPTNPQQSIKQVPAITPANAKQIAGNHYKQYGNLQPWDVIVAWKMDYLTGTALKYLARWKDKVGIDDLKKAIHFIEKQIEVAEAEATAKIPHQTNQS